MPYEIIVPTASNDPGSLLERVGRQCSAGQTRSSHPAPDEDVEIHGGFLK